MRIIAIIVFILLMFFSFTSLAGNEISYKAEIGSCDKAESDKDIKNAPHLFFSIDEGRKLWLELGLLRKDKEKFELIDKKFKLQIDITKWWEIQMSAADKAVLAQKEQVKQLHLKNSELEKKNVKLGEDIVKWQEKSARFQGQRYQFLFWGLVGGVGVTVAVVVVVVIISSGSSK